jgi:poly-gamma-glutamate capsule biosynthesis protein CapA/YwtB (metallophosphatase superfamily)
MKRIMDVMAITIFLCGDVMTGRGIDQVLPHPSPPRIFEPFVADARDYVRLAEDASGPIRKPVGFDYIWGDALADMAVHAPDVRLINLETAITKSEDYWAGKGINYRMNPENSGVLTAARIDAVTLANNHVLDWGYAGLTETIRTLDKIHVRHSGAGRNQSEAEAPAVVDLGAKGRVLVFSFGAESSGVPPLWAATDKRAGVNLLPDLSSKTVHAIGELIRRVKRPHDIVIVSIHWGGNWGYEISVEEQRFARSLVDDAGADLIHGHSSHHVKRIEVYHGKLILYGCGDFLNDYEGISGHESYRGDLGLMYFAKVDAGTGKLLALDMTPTQIRRFRVTRAPVSDAKWLAGILNREGAPVGTGVELTTDNLLRLRWNK